MVITRSKVVFFNSNVVLCDSVVVCNSNVGSDAQMHSRHCSFKMASNLAITSSNVVLCNVCVCLRVM